MLLSEWRTIVPGGDPERIQKQHYRPTALHQANSDGHRNELDAVTRLLPRS